MRVTGYLRRNQRAGAGAVLLLCCCVLSATTAAAADAGVAIDLEPSAQTPVTVPIPADPPGGERATPAPCGADDDACRTGRLGEEALGWVKLGLPARAVTKRLGPPVKRGPVVEEGATGAFVQDWSYPRAGLTFHMAAGSARGAQSVAAITAIAPCALKTRRGVAIGSTEADVRRAYAGLADPPFTKPGERFVAGSVYGGVVFDIEAGRVVRIFVGASAE